MGGPAARTDLWRLAGKASRALIAASQAASHEYRLAQHARTQAERGEAATPPPAPSSRVQTVLSASAARLVHLGFLAALPAMLIALLNPAALFGHANWIDWLTIACGATLTLMGILLALNWFSARNRLTHQLHRNSQQRQPASRTWTWRIIDPTLQLIGIAWIPIGILTLIRGSTNLH